MNLVASLLAFDVEPLITFVVVTIVVLSSIVPQVLSKTKQPPGGPARRPQARPQTGDQPRAPQANTLEDEIGEFLRRATQKAQGRPQGPPPQQRPATRPAQPRSVQQRPAQARAARPQPPVPRRAQRPIQGGDVKPERAPVGQALRSQVARERDTADIARRASHLGADARQETAKLKQHVTATFDHQLGSLAHAEAKAVTKPLQQGQESLPMTSAAGLAALLSDAESLKQAILIHEIMQRPTDRW